MLMKVSVLLSITVFTVASTLATDYYVAVGGTGDYVSSPGPSPIKAMELAVNEGDVIHLACGTYTFSNEGEPFVKAGVTLIGGSDNPEETVLERTSEGRSLYLGSNGGVRNITIRGGNTPYQGGGILGYDAANNYVHRNFSVSNCIVENAHAQYKGGAGYGGVWRDCVIRGCGVSRLSSNADDEGCGGGVYGGTLYNCVLSNNVAAVMGGGVAGSATEPLVAIDCLISHNQAPYGGGAAVNHTVEGAAGTSCRLEGCLLEENWAIPNVASVEAGWGGRGGAANCCWLTNCTVRANVVTCYTSTGDLPYGGGGCADSTAYDCDFLENRTVVANDLGHNTSGGAAADSYLESCRVSGNTAVAFGGGLLRGTAVKCWLSENSAVAGGGALQSVVRDSVISNNVTTVAEGGAVYNGSTYNCLVIHNTSAQSAVLFRGYHQGDLVVENVSSAPGEVSRGSAIATRDAYHGGLDATAVNCTIVGNRGGEGALYAVYATNCLAFANLDQNGNGADFKWPTLGVHNSLWGTGDALHETSVNCALIDDPKFVTNPRVNECRYSIRRASPCFNKGLYCDWMVGTRDLMGTKRIRHDAVDIGALECATPDGLTLLFR